MRNTINEFRWHAKCINVLLGKCNNVTLLLITLPTLAKIGLRRAPDDLVYSRKSSTHALLCLAFVTVRQEAGLDKIRDAR